MKFKRQRISIATYNGEYMSPTVISVEADVFEYGGYYFGAFWEEYNTGMFKITELTTGMRVCVFSKLKYHPIHIPYNYSVAPRRSAIEKCKQLVDDGKLEQRLPEAIKEMREYGFPFPVNNIEKLKLKK